MGIIKKKKRYWIRIVSVAASVIFVFGFLYALTHLNGKVDNELYKTEMNICTKFESYQQLEKVIGYNTLFKKINDASLDIVNISFILYHKKNAISEFSEVKCAFEINDTINSKVEVSCYFPLYEGEIINNNQEMQITYINNVKINYYQSNSSGFIEYVAYFQIDNCEYVVNISSKSESNLLYDILNCMLKNGR